ncbi:MAG: hypothetical protein ACR2H6_11960 [Pyrinomonadaceae bacterium]
MIKAGLSVDVVMAKIRTTPSHFDTTPSVLGELKAAGVPDMVIAAMVERPFASTSNTPGLPASKPKFQMEPSSKFN